jgi:hypothetical protein
MRITEDMLTEFRERAFIPPQDRYEPRELGAVREILDTIDGLLDDGIPPSAVYDAYLGRLADRVRFRELPAEANPDWTGSLMGGPLTGPSFDQAVAQAMTARDLVMGEPQGTALRAYEDALEMLRKTAEERRLSRRRNFPI